CLYYGSELGMAGGEDPEMRAPMRWDLARDDNAVLSLHRRLLALRHRKPALRYGDFRVLEAQRCLAFLRATGSARETVVVIANPTDRESVETLQIRESKFQNHTVLEDALGGQTWRLDTGLLDVTVPAHGVLVLEPRIGPSPKGYDRYDRMP
ncbi:MAG: alpha amylase, partial [bacterium]